MKQSKLAALVQCAIFAAILCVFSPFAIPIGPIPITLSIFAVMLCGVVLPWWQAVVSVVVFLALGLWLPLFSGGNTGITALPGPTGGYIWSYALMVLVVSPLAHLRVKKVGLSLVLALVGCVLSVLVCYLCGTLQFSQLAGKTFQESLAVCVIPFWVPDAIKAVAAAVLGTTVRLLLEKQGLLKKTVQL